MIGATVKFVAEFEEQDSETGKIDPDQSNEKELTGVVMDKIIREGNDLYLVVVAPTKEIVFISPFNVIEIVGLAFGVHQPGGNGIYKGN